MLLKSFKENTLRAAVFASSVQIALAIQNLVFSILNDEEIFYLFLFHVSS